jgi:hypothetical protein
MANRFDRQVILSALDGIVQFEDPLTQNILVQLQYTMIDPNGTLVAPKGSLALGPEGTFVNLNGGSSWGLMSAGAGGILWKPDGGGTATTWFDVMDIVDSTPVPMPIFVNAMTAPAIIPVKPGGGEWDLHNCALWGEQLGGPGSNIVTMDPGAKLHNLHGLYNEIALLCQPDGSGDCLTFTPAPGNPPILILSLGCAITNGGTTPAMTVGANKLNVISIIDRGIVISGAQPLVHLADPTSTLILGIGAGAASINDNWLTGVPGSTLLYLTDGTGPSPLPANAGMFGSSLSYPQGPIGQAFTLATRPVSMGGFDPLGVGLMIFVTDLGPNGAPLWWTGTAWVDATSTIVP